eukprot:TRINITY_DN11810_c1_g1_i1.p1 TRINITY_DN11810_c1_g1~~TRINITY_DN11810_c1_g1_i1.p1  ORF type:complete len:103 (-),score=8.04 TRINITY_DN11810_c1_g1_i1:102-410(-)
MNIFVRSDLMYPNDADAVTADQGQRHSTHKVNTADEGSTQSNCKRGGESPNHRTCNASSARSNRNVAHRQNKGKGRDTQSKSHGQGEGWVSTPRRSSRHNTP